MSDELEIEIPITKKHVMAVIIGIFVIIILTIGEPDLLDAIIAAIGAPQ